MAIKRRPTIDPATEAAIEAFGEAAERPSEAPLAAQTASRTAPVRRVPKAAPAPAATPADEWPADVAKTLLIRYPDLELPALLSDVARAEERSQHATALRALRRGLEVLKDENGL
jgi:hypothetical protein